MDKTQASGKIIRSYSPTIFLSHHGSFSSSPDLLANKKPSSCIEVGTGLSMSIYIYNLSEIIQTPEHSLYDFSVGVSKIEEVKAVTYQTEHNIIRVWTFIEKRDKNIRKSVYEKELELMEKYNNLIFDFNVVVLNYGEPLIPQDLQGSITYYKGSNGN